MYGELIPQGGGDAIPLFKKMLLVGRRESCDICLRFSNVSSHHCQLTLNNGYWYVKDLNSRNGLKVNGVRLAESVEKRLDPGDILSVAKHTYRVNYSPVDNGAVGPPPPDIVEQDIFSKSLLERAGFGARRWPSQRKKSRTAANRPGSATTSVMTCRTTKPANSAGATNRSDPSAPAWGCMPKKHRKIRTEFRKNRARARAAPTGRRNSTNNASGPRILRKSSGSARANSRGTGPSWVATPRGTAHPVSTCAWASTNRPVCPAACSACSASSAACRETTARSTSVSRAGSCERSPPTNATCLPREIACWCRKTGSDGREAIIERIEPRQRCLSRTVRGRQHVIVANVDQVLIIASAAEPRLKPHLIDRVIVAAEKDGFQAVVCINKVDLVDPASLEPLVGAISRMGYPVLLLSTRTGLGIERWRQTLQGRQSVLAGQSGVGKSSLLNAVDPGLQLPTATVSEETEKGRHTTTTAQLLPLSFGAYAVDTPGVRQFELWDLIAEEVVNYYRDLRPYVSNCRFPNCTHTHEADCAIKNAVADGRLDERRYESYLHLRAGKME